MTETFSTPLRTLLHQARTSSLDVAQLAWPLEQLAEGVALLAQQTGLVETVPTERPLTPPTSETLAAWLPTTAQQIGCAAQAVEWHFGDIGLLVRRAAPAILQLPQQSCFLLLLKASWRRVVLLTPEQKQVKIKTAVLTTLLQEQTSGNVGTAVADLLTATGVASQRMPQAKAALIAEQMSGQRFGGCWLLKTAAHRPIWHHLRHNRLPQYGLLLVILSLLQQLILILSWRYIGAGVFENGFSISEITIWGVLLLINMPVGLFAGWAQINLTLNLSRIARTRLLQGILNLDPTSIRHLGAGQFLERVMQTESFQSLLLGGGFAIINALIQISLAITILRLGIGGNWHSVLAAVWLLLALGFGLWYAFLFLRWRDLYRQLTNDLVERMVAHRTRLAQENKATWHLEEDQQLDNYHTVSQRLERLQQWQRALLNRGWFVVGLAGIAIPFLNGVENQAELAISVGGILLASAAFNGLSNAILSVANIYATWQDVGPIFQAASLPASVGAANNARATGTNPLLVARNLHFRYRPDAAPTLNNIDLTIYPKERLLLEGPSGGGKSTLASVLVGLRSSDSGLLLLHGLDQATVGLSNWRRQIISAPQFHENYVLTETIGFNLLMGRRWPATEADLQAATQICHELGLGDLLARMPAGMMQMVGEGGWQLSHGERSRLFIARALLQEADLIVLDESFAMLDPINLQRALTTVLQRAPTLLVIAHP